MRRGLGIGGSLIMLSLAGVLTASPASAHTMTYQSGSTFLITVGANSNSSTTIYTNHGASIGDTTWYVHTEFGLSGGDATQNASFAYLATDNGTGGGVPSVFGDSGLNWVSTGITKWGTLAMHIGTSFKLVLSIGNTDGFSQTFLSITIPAYT